MTYDNIPPTSRQFSFVPDITPPFEFTFPFVSISKHSFPFRKLKNLQAGSVIHAERHSSAVLSCNGLFVIHVPENSLSFSKQSFPVNFQKSCAYNLELSSIVFE